MNELTVFENAQFGQVRTVEREGEPWFVGKDVAAALGYQNPRDALAPHVEDEDKAGVAIHDGSQKRNMTIINESGLYALVLSSKLPTAKAFKRWVTSEVLPAIRRHGGYRLGKEERARQSVAEAKLNNSRARLAAEWRKLAQAGATPEYRQICAHYASAQLTGGEAVLPLPAAGERTYTAAEVGKMLGGVSANQIGRLANAHGLKAPGYGLEVWDKSPYSQKQVVSWRYNDRAVQRLREIQAEDLG